MALLKHNWKDITIMRRSNTTAKEKLLSEGYEDVIIFDNPSFDSALIGVSADNQTIYDWNKMVDWLVENENMTEIDAVEFIDYNTIRALPYTNNSPIIMYPLED